MARQRPDARFTESEKCFLILKIVIESSERHTAAVGWSPLGRSHVGR